MSYVTRLTCARCGGDTAISNDEEPDVRLRATLIAAGWVVTFLCRRCGAEYRIPVLFDVPRKAQSDLESAVIEAAIKWRQFRGQMADVGRSWDKQNAELERTFSTALDALLATREESK